MLFRKSNKNMSSKQLITIGMALMLCALPITAGVLALRETLSPVWAGLLAGFGIVMMITSIIFNCLGLVRYRQEKK